MVTKLDRLARSVSDARDIADELAVRQVKLNAEIVALLRKITSG